MTLTKEQKEKSERSKGYLGLLSERNYMLQTIAHIISRFGDGIDAIAFSLLIYEVTGSTLLVAVLFGINGIPNIIFGMISGVVCKYVSDKRILFICDFGRMASVGLIAFLYITGNIEVWHLYVITFINSSFEAFRGPASTSILPKVISGEKLEHGIAFSSAGCKGGELVGLAIAPFIIGVAGIGGAILIDTFTFLICAVLIILMKVEDDTVSDQKLTVSKYFTDLKEGFSYVKDDKLILNIIIFAGLTNMVIVPFNSLQAPYVDEVLNGGSTALSIMGIGVVAGLTFATVLAPMIKNKLGTKNMFIFGGIIVGITYSILALLGGLDGISQYGVLIFDIFIFGVGALCVNFPIQIVMMKKVPREFLPRVAAIFNAVALCAVPLTAFIIGIVSQVVKIKELYMIFGILTVILFIGEGMTKIVKRYNEV